MILHSLLRSSCINYHDYLFLFFVFLVLLVPQQLTCIVYGFRPPVSIANELGCSPTLTAIRNVFFLPTTRANNDNNDDLNDSERYFFTTTKKNGAKTELSPYFFDPLGLATDENFSRYREAELKHGRICMLVMLEYISIPILKLIEFHTLMEQDSSSQMSIIPSTFPESIIQQVKFSETMTTIHEYSKVVLTCLVLETFVLIQRDSKAMPGDYGVGYWGIRNKGLHEQDLIIELEHGRLSMISVAIAVALEIGSSGKSWNEQWIQLLKYWVQQF